MKLYFKPKNILMISHDYYPNIGGVAVYVEEMSKALSKMGHKVTILSQYRSEGWRIQKTYNNNIRVFRVPISRLRKLDDLQYIYRMRKLIVKLQKSEKVDVIHWHTLNKDAKVMMNIHVSGLEVYTNHLSWFRMLYNQGEYSKIYSLIKKPDYIICPSRETEKMSIKLFGDKKTRYLPNGVNPDEFYTNVQQGIEMRKTIGIPKQNKVILTTNRMEPIKGMQYFIDAIPNILKYHPNTTIVILGDGSHKRGLMDRVNSQNIDRSKVIFLGKVPNTEIKNWMNAADIYVQPSLMEGCSIAIIEAMSCSKAIIASNVGGNPDIICDGVTGMLVEPMSSAEIQEAVTYLLNNPQKIQEYGMKARITVESELNWVSLANQLTILYEKRLS
ncbi:glycosyl transferase family 1 [Bacillus thuringiensis]|uniref:Glycosyl transferase family 1 n=1 Tax=Bacillus thuringiensis TaxID=1428 RepID=A0ABD6SEI4_BACTU|nr:glycosyltransferase family 4 protein [Bacillus thuringiensis]PER50993.1 glycosyl transferase family 1 [Bacillus thuringiensis]PEU86382.1 glycosyl transferase family 1 [Bacillus thuringiensis]PFI13475.1 glycosyl transferase family 1 [Bacillus thuringiensis]PFW19018.1 glycosyl transferase family 1 [Bacillus thuringiensis]PGY84760.1 glycosyl transferase family 1 [Bacillus thuringiensis]